MARSGPAHSANSQFYINLVDNSELDPLPTRWGYAVFGQITEGMEVIEKMGVVATGSVGPFKSEAPLKPIVIEKVEPLATSTPAPAVTPPTTTPSAPSGEEAGEAAGTTPGEASQEGSGATSGQPSGGTPAEGGTPPTQTPPPQ
jgi:hypothetical protein